MATEYETDLEAKIFQTKHVVVRLLAELNVLNPKVDKVQGECDQLAEELRTLTSTEELSEEEQLKKKEITDKLFENWPYRRFLIENQMRAKKELEEAKEKLITLAWQKAQFEDVLKN